MSHPAFTSRKMHILFSDEAAADSLLDTLNTALGRTLPDGRKVIYTRCFEHPSNGTCIIRVTEKCGHLIEGYTLLDREAVTALGFFPKTLGDEE